MKRIACQLLMLGLLCTIVACSSSTAIKNKVDSNTECNASSKSKSLGVGYRWSSYGIKYNPGNEYWFEVGDRLAGYFSDTVSTENIWILGVLHDEGVMLNFPAKVKDHLIYTKSIDENEALFNKFDSLGHRIWLQVEPGNANVIELIDLVLGKYSHHKCVTGFGIDVEWYKSINVPQGKAISDEEALLWLTAIKKHNPEYKLFLKHWEINKMPPTVRKDIVFVDDSQMFDSMNDMISEFETWAHYFSPAKVAFQFGYQADKKWWGEFENPAETIGKEILKRTNNTSGLYWVDFTLLDEYPPLIF